MNLIEEIEASANSARYNDDHDNSRKEIAARDLEDSDWWPRIKAALEAAQEMDLLSRGSVTRTLAEGDRLYVARIKFREAMNEPKGTRK